MKQGNNKISNQKSQQSSKLMSNHILKKASERKSMESKIIVSCLMEKKVKCVCKNKIWIFIIKTIYEGKDISVI